MKKNRKRLGAKAAFDDASAVRSGPASRAACFDRHDENRNHESPKDENDTVAGMVKWTARVT